MHFLWDHNNVGRTASTEEFVAAAAAEEEPPEVEKVATESTSADLSVDEVFNSSLDCPHKPHPNLAPSVHWTPVESVPIQSALTTMTTSATSTSNKRNSGGKGKTACVILLTVACIGLSLALAVVLLLHIQQEGANSNGSNNSNGRSGQQQQVVGGSGAADDFEVCTSKHCKRTANMFQRTMDEDVDPCEDFPAFACGNWLKETAATVTRGTYDHTTVMRDRIVNRLKKLTENITGDDIEPLRQVKNMYDSCTNVDTLEDIGLAPIAKLLNSLIVPAESLGKRLARIKKATGQSYVFDFALNPDYRNPKGNIITIDQPQLPAGGTPYSNSGSLDKLYKKLINEAFSRLQRVQGMHAVVRDNVNNGSSVVMHVEQQLSDSISDLHTVPKASMFNLMSLRDLNVLFEKEFHKRQENETIRVENNNIGVKLNWTEYISELYSEIPKANVTEDTYVNVNDIAFVKSLAKILANTTQEDVDLYLAWQLIWSFGKDVTRDFRSLFYAFSLRIDGSESAPNRFTECINLMDTNIPFALTYRYILQFVPDELIQEATEMVGYLSRSFKQMVTQADWMDEKTKYKATLKANRMRAFLGYPKWMKNDTAVVTYHRGLKLKNDTFFDNVLSMQEWVTKKTLLKYVNPVDTTWSMDSPAEADAFYDDELNAITFPTGFLQEPFFGMGLRSVDYGALGSVIGHEITHGFDTRGRFSDEHGKLKSWWSIPTLKTFVKKAQCFVNQYNNYDAPEVSDILGDKNKVNGRRTLAENIADNGGIREAFQAYRFFTKGLGKPEARLPGLEKYTPEQLFFISFGQSWCSYNTPKALAENLQGNEHSPAKFRIIGSIANFDQFAKTWKCKANSRMNPVKKCILW